MNCNLLIADVSFNPTIKSFSLIKGTVLEACHELNKVLFNEKINRGDLNGVIFGGVVPNVKMDFDLKDAPLSEIIALIAEISGCHVTWGDGFIFFTNGIPGSGDKIRTAVVNVNEQFRKRLDPDEEKLATPLDLIAYLDSIGIPLEKARYVIENKEMGDYSLTFFFVDDTTVSMLSALSDFLTKDSPRNP